MPFFRRGSGAPGAPWIVVGLGNPGPSYERTRHNVGAMVLEILRERLSVRLRSHKSGCATGEANLSGDKVVLARPLSYMNESGRPVAALMRWYKAAPDRLVVIHDELDIPFGEIRIKVGGGVAGHNGLRSVAQHLGTNDFVRVRFGISRPPGQRDPADYVLSDFTRSERDELPSLIEDAKTAVERIVEVGPERAMNEVNARSS